MNKEIEYPSPLPGDVISTISHPKWYEIHLHLLKWGIQSEQRIRGFKEWRHTHVMLFLGKLSAEFIQKFISQILNAGLSPSDLSRHDDWIISYTFPKCTLVRWEQVISSDWYIYRMMSSNDLTGFVSRDTFHPWKHYELSFLKESAGELLGRRYDIPQLLRWIVGRLFGISRSKWKLIPDLFKTWKVCSVAVAFWFEDTRQKVRDLTGKAPWIRPFRDGNDPVDIEASMPADYANSKHYMLVMKGPQK